MLFTINPILPSCAETLCREITDDLPEYFGLPKANENYFQGMKDRMSWAAKVKDKYLGLLTLDFPYSETASIYWMGIKRAFRR